jgi:hypothetical protein
MFLKQLAEKTVELDYGGFFPRALYHQTGQELRGEDPYDIPEIRRLLERHGMDWASNGRKAVKTMVNIAISAKRKTAFFSEKSKKKISIPEDLIESCVPIIIDHHAPIKDHLLKGRALELMNLESDICQKIICRGMTDGVVILPVFDSFITTKDEEDYLNQQMMESYTLILGHCPIIH